MGRAGNRQPSQSRIRPAAGTAQRSVPGPAARPVVSDGRAANQAGVGRGLSVGMHRAIASLALALLMLLAVFAPLAPAQPNVSALLLPRIDGAGSVGVGAGATVDATERALFPYLTFIERNQGNASTWPELNELLAFDPSDPRARRAVIGQIYAESTGNLNKKIKETGLDANVQEAILSDIEATYSQLGDDQGKPGVSSNGLAALQLVRSLKATGASRADLEQEALARFQSAIQQAPDVWQFTYNWALANFLRGNYNSAYEGMRSVSAKAGQDNNKLAPFWMGMSALRVGDPAQAVREFQPMLNPQIPAGGNEAFRNLYFEVRDLSQEAIGDAYWALRQPATAYRTYLDILLRGTSTSALYAKWLRVALQGRGYERMLGDMQELSGSANVPLDTRARIVHDRARLLTFLGRGDAANAEYVRAIQLGENDATLLVSHGQALESRGDHNGALLRAEEAIRKVGRDPSSSDLTSVARAAAITTTNLLDRATAQQLLDANLLRARAWGATGNSGAVDQLVTGITQGAAGLSPNEAGLLQLYGGFAHEAGGSPEKARGQFEAAWNTLRGLPPGTAGRSAALAGLARSAGDIDAALELLRSNGYDPVTPPQTVVTDPDAPDILLQGALLLQQSGRLGEGANALRVSAITRNLQDARGLSGAGRPLWTASGTTAPAEGILQAANAARIASGPEGNLAIMRYKQAYGLDPALASAWNNAGALYAQRGRFDIARPYFSIFDAVSPGYALGRHNLAALEYRQGLGNFLSAEAARGAVVKAAGARSLNWGYDLQFDDRGAVPAPLTLEGRANHLSRLPALVILLLLLAHTLIGRDRVGNRREVVPARGALGRLGEALDGRARGAVPALFAPGSGGSALVVAILVPSLIGMLGLAWGASQGSLSVGLVFLPVAFLAALLAFGANELAQRVAAGQSGNRAQHRLWPLGLLLGVLSIPFGFVYGWQNVTRVQAAGEASRSVAGRRSRTEDGVEIGNDAYLEAQAGEDSSVSVEGAKGATSAAPYMGAAAAGRFGIDAGARILLVGLLANLALGLLFGAIYLLTGWPSMRLALFASMLVLAFTAVSEPPADGWSVYRRNGPLWLAFFIFAAAVVTLLAAGLV